MRKWYISLGAVVLRFPPAALRGQSSFFELVVFLKGDLVVDDEGVLLAWAAGNYA